MNNEILFQPTPCATRFEKLFAEAAKQLLSRAAGGNEDVIVGNTSSPC